MSVDALHEWRWAAPARKAHLFRLDRERSLCGDWVWGREARVGDVTAETSRRDCWRCWRRLVRLRAMGST